ncbi:MAG: hexose kinase [Actinomycetia bacterium]|nr:hexose kinase [Actinomycetes bacterium]
MPPAAQPRILCFGANPALDITYEVDAVDLGESHRVETIYARAGGKATNVARVVDTLGGKAHLVAPLGGSAGDLFAEDVLDSGMSLRVVAIPGETRRSIAVVESSSRATLFNEAGPRWSTTVWPHLEEVLAAEIEAADAVAISGSLPPDCPTDVIASIVSACVEHDVPVLVDTAGPALLVAIEAGATMVKPNRPELRALTDAEGLEGCRALRADHPDVIVVASDGEAGLIAVGPDGAWRARPKETVPGNPTGAGDALVAALVLGLARHTPLEESLRLGIGTGAAAVQEPVAGRIDEDTAHEFAEAAIVEALDEEAPNDSAAPNDSEGD